MAANLEEEFPTLPLTAVDRAQLDRVGYVADDLAVLRARLLARMAETFPQWNPSLPDNLGDPDFGVLFIDLFAQMTAILNAYSDARVNESFLRTAQLERSLIDLAALVDYRLAPGASAEGLQAFIAKEGGAGELPANFKVQSPGAGDKPAVIFETLAALAVSSVRNRLRHFGYNRSSRKLVLRASATAVQDASTGESITGLNSVIVTVNYVMTGSETIEYSISRIILDPRLRVPAPPPTTPTTGGTQ